MNVYRFKHFFLILICGLGLLSGCTAHGPTREQLATADYGAPISQQEAEAKITDFFSQHIDDPELAMYQWSKVQPGWSQDPTKPGSEVIFGYILDMKINRKNSLSGYTGYIGYQFVFYNGEIRHVFLQPSLSNDVTYMGKIY